MGVPGAMEAGTELYDKCLLHILPDKYYIEPVNGPNEMIVIDRLNGDITVAVATQVPLPPDTRHIVIHGIIGIIHLLAGFYLIVVTEKWQVAKVDEHIIYQMKKAEMLPYSRTMLHLTDTQLADNKMYEAMITNVLNTKSFYFSYTYDISHTLQRLHNTTPEFLQTPLMERADVRFIWNTHLLRDWSNHSQLSRYCLPLVHGFIMSRSCTVNQRLFTYTLISRRSCLRAGTRLNVRGVDTDGNVANFVETEQIVEYQKVRCSFVQIRGSIPLFWSQKPNLRYKPPPLLSPNHNHADGFQRHFDNQLVNYGRQVLINLIDHKGIEQRLERAYADMVLNLGNPNIRYEAFDFHRECAKMRWDRLSLLMDRLSSDQEKLGYFIYSPDMGVRKSQDGVFRTNCIDCLDRTNVVQSMLARQSLQAQLEELGVLLHSQKIQDQPAFESIFKSMWADNGDTLSVQYAGTGALKTDYTRTGKRTYAGLLKDGINSASRYVRNNFFDGFRQDALDLFLGHYEVEEGEGVTKPSPLHLERELKYLALPVILAVAIAMCFLTLLVPAEYTVETMLYFLFWVAMSTSTFIVVMYYGTEYVDQPKLARKNL